METVRVGIVGVGGMGSSHGRLFVDGKIKRGELKAVCDISPKALEASAQGRVALLFGREDKGLMNEELALCTQIIQIPTTTEIKNATGMEMGTISGVMILATSGRSR